MSETVLKIGLLGCGPIAQFAHLPALAKARRVALRAICDGAEDLLHTMGQRYGVQQLYQDYATFLREADIDAVLIAVPDAFHVPLAAQALAAGKHVLVEKPLGVNSDECRELLRAVQRTGLKLQVGAMKRHDPGIAFAHRFVRERLGQILSVSGWYCDTLFRPAFQETLLPPTVASQHAIRPLGRSEGKQAALFAGDARRTPVRQPPLPGRPDHRRYRPARGEVRSALVARTSRFRARRLGAF